MLLLVVQIAILVLIAYIVFRPRSPLNDIPGPKSYPLVGNVLQLDTDNLFINLTDFAKQYGGICKIYLFRKPVVIVNDYQFIHDVLVKQSADFAGRPKSYRLELLLRDYTELAFNDGPEHRGRKKAMHTYMKQFGSGIQKLEDVIQTASDDLITRFAKQHGSPIDVRDFLFRCLTDIIAVLLIGDTTTPKTIKDIEAIMESDNEILGPGSGILLDWFPFLRFVGNKTYKQIQHNVKLYEHMINEWIDSHPSEGFINFLQSMSDKEKKNSFLDSKKIHISMSFAFLSAGIVTTSATLTSLMNVLCHYPDIQEKVHREIMEIIGPARHPTWQDQDNMPYLRATILEIGRFASSLPIAIPHKTLYTCKLSKYTIPKDTEIWTNLWSLHHDEKLWDEPFTFKPERFLDAGGQLVPADHPNRRNTMPFGAGLRVCVGEVFALSRMFLITARILQNFTILPEASLKEQPSCDPRDMQNGLVLFPPPFKVRMVPVSASIP